MGDMLSPSVSKDRKTEKMLAEQKKEEERKKVELESEIAEKKLSGQKTLAGRGSLITKKTGEIKKKMGE